MLANNVFDAALERLLTLYENGHRIVVSFSAGKDSGVALELCILAAQATGRLPVEVLMRDEEIMFPGTFEYAERIAARPEVDFHWVIAHQPIINIFNREAPYFWVMDPQLPPEAWVRTPPAIAYTIPELNIQAMVNDKRFPPAEGKNLYAVLGLRTSESMTRRMGLLSSKGWLTGKSSWGVRNARPIYDWGDGDIWRAIYTNGWDYNNAYDVMHRMGVSRSDLRIAPPTMTAISTKMLSKAAAARPRWFDRVCERLPGVRTASQFGRRAVEPLRREGETWEDCFRRTCLTDAPAWISERAQMLVNDTLLNHGRHSTQALPQVTKCLKCKNAGSWRVMALTMYMGDPFALKHGHLPYVEPEFFRPGSGTWGGKPSF
jgi:predicted phosphoadenosine phosphosulfate sulfurtransferase